MRQSLIALACLAGVSCSGGGNSPTSPSTPTPTPTHPPVVTLQSVTLRLDTAAMNLPGTSRQVSAAGAFSNGTTQDVTATCAGWASDSAFVLTLTSGGVAAAHNSGQATITTTCQGVFAKLLATIALAPLFTQSGNGNNVFTLPTYISKVQITGTYSGYSSNFIVMIAGRLVVNDLIGTGWRSTVSDGVYVTAGGQVQIVNSSGVSWTFTEVR